MVVFEGGVLAGKAAEADVVVELSSALGEIEVRVGEVTEGVWAVAEVSVGMTVVAVMVRGGKVLTVKLVPEGKAASVAVSGGKVAETLLVVDPESAAD